MNTFRTGCDVVERTQETFVQWVMVGGERQRAEFTREILWIQESETRTAFYHGGKELTDLSMHNDFYGYLTSCDDIGTERVADTSKITPESSLDLIAKTTIFLHPAIETEATRSENEHQSPKYKKVYAYLPDDWRKEACVDGEVRWLRIQKKELASEVTWTSKNTPEENAALKQCFKNKWPIVANQQATGT